MTTILIVEDEESLADPLAYLLQKEGFDTLVAQDGPSALDQFGDNDVDLVLLDLMLPGMSGTEVCKSLRSVSSVPIIMVTARDTEIDKVVGLELGADDYVTKPYSTRELIARIRAVLRRTASLDDDDAAVLRVDDLELDDDAHEVRRGGEVVELSPTEFKLLRYLMMNPNRVLSKAQILDHVWEYDFNGDASIVESYISYLRRKIDVGGREKMIHTKRGVGYMLRTADKR